METKQSKNGRRLFTIDQKKKIVEEMLTCTAAEVSRKYGVGVGMLYRWRQTMTDGQNTALRTGESPVAASELKKAQDEIKRLQRALGKKTMECDILQEAVEIANKKKWI
jgi:transposase